MKLTETELHLLKVVLRKHLDAASCRVLLFGSRIDGSARPGSDLDIMIFATGGLSFAKLGFLREAMENSNLPFSVDISDAEVVEVSFRTRATSGGVWLDLA